MNQRHTEFFGPDLARGPFAASRIETAAVQIATALAQLRAPVGRSDADLKAHADLIRELADRLAPDYAAFVSLSVGPEISNNIQTSFRTALTGYSLFHCWLADDYGGGETSTAPNSVTWNSGIVLAEITAKKRYFVITNASGVADVTVNDGGARTWFWAVARHGRVNYSSSLFFS
ncbi:MAG: hypothetical protein CHACPFDD_03981 [Phycisphaerae bacterium]|nr:hypothetical protein [Phycisphaerae bacterium]